jgi:hypothetical protein
MQKSYNKTRNIFAALLGREKFIDFILLFADNRASNDFPISDQDKFKTTRHSVEHYVVFASYA